MGERKVLNKYFPPDFDPSELPRRKRPKTNDMKVRMMLPMSVRCKTCGNFMYKGTKFNTRKEDVMGETYLGIQIFRFYYRCKNCAAEFTMKTDPKTSDYVLEEGASRNYEHWREEEQVKQEVKKTREEEEMGNAMKALENRTLDSKREMDIMAALDEMRTLKAKHSKVSTEEALAALQREADKQLDQGLRDEEAQDLAEFYRLRKVEQAKHQQLHGSSSSSGSDDDEGRGGGGQRGPAGPGKRGGGNKGRATAGMGISLAAAALMDEDGEEGVDGLSDSSEEPPAGARGNAGSEGAAGAGQASGDKEFPSEAAQGSTGAAAPEPAGPIKDPLAAALATATGAASSKPAGPRPVFKVVAKPKPPAPQPSKTQADGPPQALMGLGGYGSSSDADSQ